MIYSAVAQRYAQALLELAITKKSEDQFLQELQRVQVAFDKSEDLRTLFVHPKFDVKIRKSVLESIMQSLAVSPTCRNFLFLLTDKNRVKYLSEILGYYQILLDEAKGRIRATVISAQALNEIEKSRLKLALKKLLKKEILLEEKVDASIIGGIITKVDGKVYDGSIRTQIEKLTLALHQ